VSATEDEVGNEAEADAESQTPDAPAPAAADATDTSSDAGGADDGASAGDQPA